MCPNEAGHINNAQNLVTGKFSKKKIRLPGNYTLAEQIIGKCMNGNSGMNLWFM